MKKCVPICGAGVDVDPRALVGELGDHPGQERDPQLVEDVGEALERDREDAGVGEDDLLVAAGGRVALVGGLDVRADRACAGRAAARGPRGRAPSRARARIGVLRRTAGSSRSPPPGAARSARAACRRAPGTSFFASRLSSKYPGNSRCMQSRAISLTDSCEGRLTPSRWLMPPSVS